MVFGNGSDNNGSFNNMEIAALSESIRLLDEELLEEGITDPLEREHIIYLGMLLTRSLYASGEM